MMRISLTNGFPEVVLSLLLLVLLVSVSQAGQTPLPDTMPLLVNDGGEYRYEPQSLERNESGELALRIFGSHPQGRTSQVKYEISCRKGYFRQLEVIEEHNGTISICTSQSDPITLKPEKHLVPAKLFELFCR